MRDFHMTFKAANYFPIIQGFALVAWNHETNPWCAADRVSDGYIAQEAWRNRQSGNPPIQ